MICRAIVAVRRWRLRKRIGHVPIVTTKIDHREINAKNVVKQEVLMHPI